MGYFPSVPRFLRHQAIAQQPEPIQLRVLTQQLKVGDSIRVAGKNDLSRIATLRNMMRNIQNDHARQSGHEVKIAERVQSAASECLGWYLGFPEWERIIGVLSVCPQISQISSSCTDKELLRERIGRSDVRQSASELAQRSRDEPAQQYCPTLRETYRDCCLCREPEVAPSARMTQQSKESFLAEGLVDQKPTPLQPMNEHDPEPSHSLGIGR